jgi:hypothetical protein
LSLEHVRSLPAGQQRAALVNAALEALGKRRDEIRAPASSIRDVRAEEIDGLMRTFTC